MTETKTAKILKSDAEWREQLTPEQYHITRQKGTEAPFTGALYRNHDDGAYHCVGCKAELFKSDAKFESGSGWPSFYLPADSAAVETHEDNASRRSHLRRLRSPSRTRLPRRPQTHRPQILHQLSRSGI